MSIADAVLSVVTDALPGDTPTFDAHVPRRADGTPLQTRYVVIYPDLGVLSSPALCGDLATSRITFRFVYVATTRAEVETMCGAVRGAILGGTFVDGDGWVAQFDPDEFHNTTPVTWDEDIPDRLVMYATDEFAAMANWSAPPSGSLS